MSICCFRLIDSMSSCGHHWKGVCGFGTKYDAEHVTSHRRLIEELAKACAEQLKKHVRDEEPLAVVQAPPGSGKTHLLMEAVKEAHRNHQRVAIATQTRSQADSICRRMIAEPFLLPAIRFVARRGQPADLPAQIGDSYHIVIRFRGQPNHEIQLHAGPSL